MADSETRVCPNCGRSTQLPAVRQATIGEIGVIDFGWRCEHCEHRFGFEQLTDEWLANGGQLTNEQPARRTNREHTP